MFVGRSQTPENGVCASRPWNAGPRSFRWYSLIGNEDGPDETLRRRQATQRRVAQVLGSSH
jgi:hypothetical protein